MYHKKNVDFAYLMWEDFVYQVEHKDAKKSNEMYYLRFTKVIVCYFMTKDPSMPRRNKVSVMLPVELTNEDIRNSEAYKEYYAAASGAAPIKTKASIRKTKSNDDDDQDDDDQDDIDDDQDTDNVDDDFVHPKISIHKEEDKDKEALIPSFKHQKTQMMKSSSVSSQFVTSMLNPSLDAGIDSLFEITPWVDVQASTIVAPLTLTAPTLPPSTIPTMSEVPQAPTPPTTTPNRGSKRRREGKEPESTSAPKEKATKTTGKSTQGSKSHQKTVSADDDQPIAEASQHPEWFQQQKKPPTPDQTLTPELLAGLTYELMKGSCKSLVELEFFLEEVYKATTDQLDWNNPKGHRYPHNLLKPRPLIPNFRGIPFDHFINNNLEYLRGGTSSHKYTTSVTKIKASYYGHIKWIEDLIVEWHDYKHLDWITVRRDDEKLYKFKEGDFKRLRIQEIKDIMFTRSIVIQRRVEDLQLCVKSYQKKLNLTKPDTYRFDLKRKEAYIAYSNPRGFIYQNKDKQNMLMQIDELHKFSDGTLTNVRAALDDRLKGIRMKYLPQTI
nr:hypothetical protein [Tanacetum cinerariifolium]